MGPLVERMTGRPDVAIVGAGVVGAACAYALAREGLSVDVFDTGFSGGGTTAAGMGHIVVMDDSDPQLALTSWSRTLLDECIDELPESCEYTRCGTLWLARDETELDAARVKRDRYLALRIRAELLDADQLADAEPELARAFTGALRVPDDGVLYPPALAWWLLGRAMSHGARVAEHSAVDSVGKGSLISRGLRMDVGLVVNAAGAAAPALTPGLPIMPRKGHLAITDRYPELCRHQLIELGYQSSAHKLTDESVAFNIQPRGTGQMLIGSSRELVGWDASINRAVLGRMLARAITFVPGLARAHVSRVWTGFRAATPHKLPLIGPWDDDARTWIAAGHEGLGITMALGTGALLADLILGRSTALDAVPFAPSRAPALVEA